MSNTMKPNNKTMDQMVASLKQRAVIFSYKKENYAAFMELIKQYENLK